MADLALRHAQRSGDATGLLVARLRAGDLTHAHVELAARLGHPAARELLPDAGLVDWAEWGQVHAAILDAGGGGSPLNRPARPRLRPRCWIRCTECGAVRRAPRG